MTQVRIGKKVPRLSLDVEFRLEPGVTALFGPPASGKTLILECIAGFTRPESGRILFDDTILFDAESGVNVPPRRRACGYVFQHDSLFPHMTVRQNLVFAAKRWPRLERHRRVSESLDRFQLTAQAAGRPSDLTPPQTLLASIARALIGEPKLLLLDDRAIDEPLLRQIRAIYTCPILLVTRDLDLVCAAAGQLIVLEGGRILQAAAPRKVLDEPASVEAARLLGIPNLLECTIKRLDPGRNSSLLEFEHFELSGPYIPAQFRGGRVWVAIDAQALRVHGADPPANSVAMQLVRTTQLTHSIRLEFSNSIFVDLSRDEFERQKDNEKWWVEFPPESLHIL